MPSFAKRIIRRFIKQFILYRAVKKGLTVGKNFDFYWRLNFGSEPYLIKIGDNVRIANHAILLTHDGSSEIVRRIHPRDHLNRYGKIVIGNNCFIGTHSIIMPNVTIGDNCIIGAGSVVTKDVPSGTVVAGNPARFLCNIEDFSQKVISETILHKGETVEELRNYFFGNN